MYPSLYQALTEDHHTLGRLLQRIADGGKEISPEVYGEYRSGQFRHIFVEERYIIPAIIRVERGRESGVVARLRLDHRALQAVLVLPPTQGVVRLVRHILAVHHAVEEEEGGLYRQGVLAVGEKYEEVLEMLDAPFAGDGALEVSGPGAYQEAKRAVERAGYRFLEG